MTGKRNTEQKRIILDELMVSDHPTATELYSRIHTLRPGISRATVFRVLDGFARDGVIRKLELIGCDTRYDGHTEPHAHCHCVRCGKITDVYGAFDKVLGCKSVEGFKVGSVELEFTGVCAECAKK